MIIGITGTLAAGKGTIVEYLCKKGFKHYSMSGFITEEVIKRSLTVNRDSMVAVGNELREKFGSSYIAGELYKRAISESRYSVIESLRTPDEICFLKSKDKFYLFSIDANQSIRYNRAVERRSEKDRISLEKFIENESIEMNSSDPTKQNLKACIELADFKFSNNKSIKELYLQMDQVFKMIKFGK